MENGLFPWHIASVCGAALCYDYEEDPDARRLQGMISSQGVEKTFQEVSSVDPFSEFGKLVLDSYRELQELKQKTREG
jgi:hypothetical protein